jgi:hypothetical protein
MTARDMIRQFLEQTGGRGANPVVFHVRFRDDEGWAARLCHAIVHDAELPWPVTDVPERERIFDDTLMTLVLEEHAAYLERHAN